jgi:hypothetical protein
VFYLAVPKKKGSHYELKCADEAAAKPNNLLSSQVYRWSNAIPKGPKLDQSPVATPPISTQLTVISGTSFLLRPTHSSRRSICPTAADRSSAMSFVLVPARGIGRKQASDHYRAVYPMPDAPPVTRACCSFQDFFTCSFRKNFSRRRDRAAEAT